MGKAVERKTKKKGRPSLLDLQKRRIKEQAELEQQIQLRNQKSRSHNDPNSNTPITSRRSIRRDTSDGDEEDDDDEEDQSARKKKPLPRHRDSASDGENEIDDVEDDERSLKKRKISAIAGGSGSAENRKAEKLVSGGTHANTHQVIVADGGNGTPLPDKKLLVFILDRLEKKDTYGVFSEPVDPEELPDYHEVIKHPMDFSTVRKKLDGGEYANLEDFENDVFLICSNAMQYNAPDTVYFRQAKSIQELAEKSFDNLRRDSDADDDEQEPKRRGRPPTKHLKKPVGRPFVDRAGSDNASGAALATSKESAMWSNYDLRKCSPMEKPGSHDSAGRSLLNPGNSEAYNSGRLSQQKLDRNDGHTGFQLRRGSYKQGKTPVSLTENRRDTYKQSHPSVVVNNSSVFSTFDVEKKMLLPVGLHAEFGYARSLARFAAGLGPVVWGIASKKIEKSLPPEVNFGPGWVGYDDVNPKRPMLSNPSSLDQARASDPNPLPSVAAHSALKIHVDQSKHQQEGDNSLGYQLASVVAALDCPLAATISIPSSSKRPLETSIQSSEVISVSPENRVQLPQSTVGGSGQKPPFEFQLQGPSASMYIGMNQPVSPQPQLSQFNMQLKMNMLNMQPKVSQHGLQQQVNQHADPQLWIPTGFNHNHPQTVNLVSRASTNASHPMTGSSSASDGTGFITNRSIPTSESMAGGCRPQFHSEPTLESVPPDLNVRFQSPSSPSSSRMDSKQHPDLALQL